MQSLYRNDCTKRKREGRTISRSIFNENHCTRCTNKILPVRKMHAIHDFTCLLSVVVCVQVHDGEVRSLWRQECSPLSITLPHEVGVNGSCSGTSTPSTISPGEHTSLEDELGKVGFVRTRCWFWLFQEKNLNYYIFNYYIIIIFKVLYL